MSVILFDVLKYSENGLAMISAGDKEVGLKIRVTNKGGEDAHHSQLLATFPESLSYASYMSKEKSVSQHRQCTSPPPSMSLPVWVISTLIV